MDSFIPQVPSPRDDAAGTNGLKPPAAVAMTTPIVPLPPSDVLSSVRIGKVKPFAGQNSVRSAINKLPQQGKVRVENLGLIGDEQQFFKHGGPDKALHQYCAAHYQKWNDLAPGREELFKVGGFGENLSSELLHEGNVCIGDKFKLGDEVVIQVSEPRQPCYKLNMRFEYKKTSRVAQSTGRTGWYYRIVTAGFIQEGDRFELIDRPHPEWSISRVQHFLYHDMTNVEAATELSQLPALGDELRGIFAARVQNGVEDMMGRLDGNRLPVAWRPYKLVGKDDITPRVKKFVFEVQDSHKDIEVDQIEFGHFPHVRLQFGPDSIYSRAYSVVSGNLRCFELGVARDDKSRGGSGYLHDSLMIGDTIKVAKGYEAKSPIGDGINGGAEKCIDIRKHVFIIGGIGVTAFLLELKSLTLDNVAVHYAVRSKTEAAFLDSLPGPQTTLYTKNEGERLNLEEVIPKDPKDVIIYCCGPSSLMEATQAVVSSLKYPRSQLHFEDFGGATTGTGEPFEAEIKETGQVFQVPGEKSLLTILNEAGFDVDNSCLVGNCGNCVVDYCDGEVEHKGLALEEEQKIGSMLSCVSRGRGRVILDI